MVTAELDDLTTRSGHARSSASSSLAVAGLFAGIGGIERGLHQSGHETRVLCEVWDRAQDVLRARFGGVTVAGDVRDLTALPDVDLIAAGFPCQDLSQAGRTRGISGPQSSLVENVFRLLGNSSARWVLLENVPFMLHLERGRAMRFLIDRLEHLQYRWAYRVVDARAFGLPQRRHRVLLLASKSEDPRTVLFADNAAPPDSPSEGNAYGFYWTEGLRGLGWAVDAVPTLKGGSAIGIPSSPAVWVPHTGEVGTLDIRDAERLQGFPADWTLPAARHESSRNGPRWKLVGNAVSVPMAAWIGARLADPGAFELGHYEHTHQMKWPTAAFGENRRAFAVDASTWPIAAPRQALTSFLQYPLTPLSSRAARGFLSRARASTLRFAPGFLEAVERHCSAVADRTS